MLGWVVEASHLVRHSLRVHVRRLHPLLVHPVLRSHTVSLEVRWLYVTHWAIHVGAHSSKLVHVGRSPVLWDLVSIVIVLVRLWVHPLRTIDSSGWLLMEPGASVIVWLSLHVATRTHLLLVPLPCSMSHRLVTRETGWRRLVAVGVVARLSPLSCIVEPNRPRENELALHLGDCVLSLVRGCETKESVAFRLAGLHIIDDLRLVY